MDNPSALLDAADVFHPAPYDSRIEQMEIARGLTKNHHICVNMQGFFIYGDEFSRV